MALNVVNLKKLPEGKTTGIIVSVEPTDTIFDRAKGPEKTVEITIQPKNPEVGIYKPLTVNFSPEINPLSGMGHLIKRLGVELDYENLTEFNEQELVGIEVSFNVFYDKQFPKIQKDSIVAL